MDSSVEQFQRVGGSIVMLAKGKRAREVGQARGYYPGSIGGTSAELNLKTINSHQAKAAG